MSGIINQLAGSRSGVVGRHPGGSRPTVMSSLWNHITTINFDVSPYTSTVAGTANAGGDVNICNIFSASDEISGRPAYAGYYDQTHGFTRYELYFDGVSHSADSEFRCKMITGTNSGTGDELLPGYISHSTPSGLSVTSSTWHVGIQSGPDQDGNSHNSSYTTNAWYSIKPAADQSAQSDVVLRLKIGTNQGGRYIWGYANGGHDHTDTATGPYQSHGKYSVDLNSTVVNGLFLQASGGNFDSGQVRIYGRRGD